MKNGIFLAVTFTLFTAWQASGESKPFIESIIGPSPVNVIKDGKIEAADEGVELTEKEKVQTGAQSSARISYPDGSQLILGRDSLLELDAVNADGAHGSHLLSGAVQAIIEKKTQKVAQAGNKYKFFIRTESAVMGVRGTEFIVEQNQKDASTQLHTLSGTVDVAKNQDEFTQGKVSPVHENEALQADVKGVTAPVKFDRVGYLQKYHDAQPESQKISENKIRTRRQVRTSRIKAQSDGGKKPGKKNR